MEQEIKQLQQALEEERRKIDIIRSVSLELNVVSSLDEKLSTILKLLDQRFNLKHTLLLIPDASQRLLTVIASRGFDESPNGQTVRYGEGIIGTVAEKRKKMRLARLSQYRRYANAANQGTDAVLQGIGLPNADSQVVLPLIANNELVAVLSAESPYLNFFSQKDEDFLMTLSSEIARSIQNSILYEKLEEMVTRRTSKLYESLEALQTLYTTITHEFRTPLTIIMGIADEISDSEQRKLITRNSKKLLQLINEMLDLSRLDSGSLSVQYQQGDIISYLNYLTESFYSVATAKGINLTFYSEVRTLIMDYDEKKLQLMIYNLLSNALKFTNASGKVVLHVKPLDSDRLQLKVQDTGIGIPEQSLPRIFDRFFQVDNSLTRPGEGTGIGLAVVKEYVELMGGSVEAASQPGEGSEFIIILPIHHTAPMISREEENNLRTEENTLQRDTLHDHESIELFMQKADDKPILLIVDDNRDVVTYLRNIVVQDYQVETAYNGKEGLDKALELIPDVIISDVMMPEMDGNTLTRTLKSDERTSHIPIILVTAKAGPQDRVSGLESGADAYLSKPFNKQELLVRLEKLTELRRDLQQHYVGKGTLPDLLTQPHNLEDTFLRKVLQIIDDNLDNADFTIVQFCRALQMSQPQVYRKLTALTGKSPSVFLRSVRLSKAAQMLKSSEMNISEVAWATGFSDPNYFSRAFSQEFGTSPSEWRN